jgi:ABC-type transport system involved in multi-copper enzyme maturation permease subunit
MADASTIRTEDVLAVRSRVSWGAIISGVFVALAVAVLMLSLGAALGFSASGNVRGDYVATGVAIWGVLTALVSLFLGGWVVSQFTAGENKLEAFLYGVILWGVIFTVSMVAQFSILRTMFGAVISTADVAATAERSGAVDWNKLAKDANLSQEQLDRIRGSVPTSQDVQQAVDDPEFRKGAIKVSWWSLAAIVVSMLAAVGGSLTGSGPTPVFLRAFTLRRTTVATTNPPYTHSSV